MQSMSTSATQDERALAEHCIAPKCCIVLSLSRPTCGNVQASASSAEENKHRAIARRMQAMSATPEKGRMSCHIHEGPNPLLTVFIISAIERSLHVALAFA